jgi:hypothetical protein
MLGRDLSAGRWETEVAHLAGQGMTNAEIAAGLFITPPRPSSTTWATSTPSSGVKGRHQLRRLLSDSRRPAPAGPSRPGHGDRGRPLRRLGSGTPARRRVPLLMPGVAGMVDVRFGAHVPTAPVRAPAGLPVMGCPATAGSPAFAGRPAGGPAAARLGVFPRDGAQPARSSSLHDQPHAPARPGDDRRRPSPAPG